VAPIASNEFDGLILYNAELNKTNQEIRNYRWRRFRNRARKRILRTHKAFLEILGLRNPGWLAPSLVLGVPAFAIGVLTPMLFHSGLPILLLTGVILFALTTALASVFYRSMHYQRILDDLSRLDDQNQACQANIRRLRQRCEELVSVTERMQQAARDRANHTELIEHRQAVEVAQKIQRLRVLLGHQPADPWGSVAIVFSCLALAFAILGFCSCGATYWIAVPFAIVGLCCALSSRSERRTVALVLSLVTFIPLLLVGIILFLTGTIIVFHH
jgi:hypothetical protein